MAVSYGFTTLFQLKYSQNLELYALGFVVLYKT